MRDPDAPSFLPDTGTRTELALESIAGSLHKLANPLLVVQDDGTLPHFDFGTSSPASVQIEPEEPHHEPGKCQICDDLRAGVVSEGPDGRLRRVFTHGPALHPASGKGTAAELFGSDWDRNR